MHCPVLCLRLVRDFSIQHHRIVAQRSFALSFCRISWRKSHVEHRNNCNKRLNSKAGGMGSTICLTGYFWFSAVSTMCYKVAYFVKFFPAPHKQADGKLHQIHAGDA